ncbi:MAG: aldehyde dehydrogenase family protein [Candidatus Sigynarchaeum springense]
MAEAAAAAGNITIKNKYTGEVLGTVPADTAETLRKKIKKCAENTAALRKMTFDERAQWLGKVATKLRFKKNELKKLIVAEGGLPIKYSEWELSIVSNGFKFAEWYHQFVEDKPLTNMDGEQFSRIVYVPQGMAACISPRNTPISLPLYQMGANYLVGNPAIVKPSTACPLTMIEAFKIMKEMGLPALDSYDLCIAPGDWVIDEFIQNRLIKTILSISSSHTAKDIIVQYAKFLKKSIDNSMGVNMYTMPFKHFVFECAGNDAGIIMDDVNLEKVAEWNVKASYTNGGQQCFSMKRIIVHKNIYDQYIEVLKREMSKLKVGDPMDPDVDIGPVGSRKILMMMDIMTEDAKEHGCKVLHGGTKIDTGSDFGLFFDPTLVEIPADKVNDLSKAPFLFREEAFGPVRSITKAENIKDAIRLANLSNYGMRAAVYTTSEDNIKAFKQGLEVANLYINARPLMTDISVMLGGIKDSAYPPGAKYYAQELVYQKYIYDGTAANLDKIK